MTSPIRLHKVRLRQNPPDLSRFPDFLIIGPQRTGTTWLYRNLRQHPQIFLPDIKETYYFSTLGNVNHPRFEYDYLEDYLALFKDSTWRFLKKTYDCLRKSRSLYLPRVRGEATATYATLEDKVISDITTLNPRIRIILMLRDPIERAWSHAKKDLMRKNQGLTAILDEEYKEYLATDNQQKLADYSSMIRRWKSHLLPDHLFLGDFRKIQSDPEGLLSEIMVFLGVTPRAMFRNRHLTERINSTDGIERSEELEKFMEERFVKAESDYRDLCRTLKW